MLLAGDVGGTKTNLAVFSLEDGPRVPIKEATFPSGDYPSLEVIVAEYLTRINLNVEQACFGVAGPVVGGRAEITNLCWVMEEEKLKDKLQLSNVYILNDLESIAYAIPSLDPSDLHTLNSGKRASDGAIGVIAPGTGLGEAFLVWDGSRYRAYPSEGGHTSFSPTNPPEIHLLQYLQDRFGHVSHERVCSGMGLPNIYAFLKERKYYEEPPWLNRQLSRTDDSTPVIVQAALDKSKSCKLCVETLNTFVSIMGSEAGNLALKVLATGGVYLGGGIPPRILPILIQPSFMEAFINKGRMSVLLTQSPVHVILNPKAALFGAACYGLDTWEDRGK